MAEILAEGFCSEDRRRVVNSGMRVGRDVGVKDLQAAVDVIGITYLSSLVIATRGERLELISARVGNGEGPEAVRFEVLQVTEIDSDERIAAVVTFDVDDIDAAFEELDARYLAGEAAPHPHTWSVVSSAYAAMSRHELFATTPGWVNVDHRRPAILEKGGLNASLHSLWNLVPDINFRIESVHRLSSLGAVCTHVAHGVSQEGFDAEWRGIEVMTVDGRLISRCEIFDEADLDVALTHFEELHSQTRRLENAATRADDRFFACFRARDWAALAESLTDASFVDDRSRVVNVGFWDGRDTVIANLRALEEAGANITSTAIATRGERLALSHMRSPSGDLRYGEFDSELLIIAEIDTQDRIAAHVVFGRNDIDAAVEELETRYLAGEAAAHAQTWSVITRAYAAANRNELPPTTPDWVTIDHRRGRAFAPGDLVAYLRASWDLLNPDIKIYIEVVHRLSDLGAVVTHVVNGSSREGFDAEWREISISTMEGDLISRCEMFDEADLDAALARFEELQPRVPRPGNAASRAFDRYLERVVAHDWGALAENLADDYYTDDRRHVVGGGIYGRDAEIASVQVQANLGVTQATATVIASRGERLALCRVRYSGDDQELEVFVAEMLIIVELNADDRFAAAIAFDLDDIDAAVEELDSRYIAGEAGAHSQTWSVVARAYTAINRHELPATTPDWVNMDHRRGIAFAPGDATAYLRASQDPQGSVYVETVHRLSNLGAVFTWAGHGTSQEGFQAEWRGINVLTVEGDLINRGEIFDEADIDAALARFDELHPRAPRLQNAATQVYEHLHDCFKARDWNAIADILVDDYSQHDRRPIVGGEIRRGRDALLEDLRAAADLEITKARSHAIGIRGERLVLTLAQYSRSDEEREAFGVDLLQVAEIDADERITALVAFDPDDINAAYAELDARYLAGEASAHAHTWSVIAGAYAGFNRHELPTTAPDWVYVDHRPLVSTDASNLPAYIRAGWDLMPYVRIYMESVHRLTDLGVVVTHTARGVSHEDLDVEWRMVNIFTVDGDMISRCEMFDEADLSAALTRFDELSALLS